MTAKCINRRLAVGDRILCSPDLPIFRYLSGRVTEVFPHGSPEHRAVTSCDCDCIAVSFDRGLSPQREREFYSQYTRFFESTPFSYDTVYLPADEVVRITEISGEKRRELLESEANARRIYRGILRRDLDETVMTQCGVDPTRYPEQKPASFNYGQAREDILRLCRELSAAREEGRRIA